MQAVVQELGGERIDIVPWHAEPEIFARRSLAPARVSKVVSDPERQVITAIVDEDQLSLAIGRNGQNVRLASQLIGWQIDLYGSREWVELGADLSLFQESGDGDYETSDFSLAELDLAPGTLAALGAAGFNTFLQIIDFSRDEFMAIEGLTEADADRLLTLIDELTVVADSSATEGAVVEDDASTAGDASDTAEAEDTVDLEGTTEEAGGDETDDVAEAGNAEVAVDEVDESGSEGLAAAMGAEGAEVVGGLEEVGEEATSGDDQEPVEA